MSTLARQAVRLLLTAGAALLTACATQAPQELPPIVFVHGNGDSAAVWLTTEWRFESNGWPRDRLFAVDLPYPLARSDDRKPQAGRSSSLENRQNLAAEVVQVRRLTGAEKVVLYGNSRGGNAIRDYVRNGGGALVVSKVILGGATNHGVWAGDFGPGNEFNGDGPFMKALNSPQGPDRLEVTPGVAFLTLRSDTNDKYAQPDGRWIGQPHMATHIGYDAPALKGAKNVVLPGLDHRETAFHPLAFAQAYRFITGHGPERTGIAPESKIVLDGHVTGFLGKDPTNLPLSGARVEIYETSRETGERLGGPVHEKTVGADGEWGPFNAKPGMQYEFVLSAPGFAVTHIYRSPFPRSSSIVNLRPARIAETDRAAGAIVTMTRPRGYFGLGRDAMSLDGKAPPGVKPGVPGVSSAKLKLDEAAPRAVVAVFRDERIVARSWPLKDNHLVFAEFHY
ncbi:MAG TPA: twin-arginine translocation pathway signal [Burkholderiales bacterium]|nr:twin-arginine translocation pathway signal [Burkholderiales bacterium]